MNLSSILGVLALATVLLPPPAALGQEAAPTVDAEGAETTPPADSALQEESNFRHKVADRIARVALLFIRNTPDPAPSDYGIVRIALEEAERLRPEDPTLLRRLLETAHAVGDGAGVLDYTSRILKLNPGDTVAQLRLVSARIRRIQEAEKRIAAYERLLSPAGNRLDASVRSRLAFDGAMLARELGQTERFIEWLTLATELDMTNKEAAILAANYSLPRIDDPLARVELLANVLLADPVDPSAHVNLARELMSQGSYDAARRFYERGAAVLRAAGENPEERIGLELMAAFWATEGAVALLDNLNDDEAVERYQIDRVRRSLREAGVSEAEIRERVPGWSPNASIERVRLLAATAVGRDSDADSAFERLNGAFDAGIKRLTEDRPDLTPRERRQIQSRVVELKLEILWVRLLTGRRLDDAQRQIEELREDLTANAMTRYEGWLLLQQGELESALSRFEEASPGDHRARLGRALARERLGRDREAIRTYAEVALTDPSSLLGLWARTRISESLGEPIRPTSVARSLRTYVNRLPEALDAMTVDPHSFIELRVDMVDPEVTALERAEVRLRLKNIGPFPLAVGPVAPINSAIMLAPRITADGYKILRGTAPEVVSIDRKLRLKTGEMIETTAWADQGATGIVLDEHAARQVTLRWRAIQGFSLTDGERGQQYQPGTMSVTAETNRQRRLAIVPPGPTLEDFDRELNEAEGERLLELILYSRTLLMQHTRDRVLEAARPVGGSDDRFAAIQQGFDRNPEAVIQRLEKNLGRFPSDEMINLIDVLKDVRNDRARIARIVAERYPSMSPEARAFAIIVMPPAWSLTATEAFDRIAQEDESRLPRLVYLLTRAGEADDPAFDTPVVKENPELQRLADLLRHRLEERSADDEAVAPAME